MNATFWPLNRIPSTTATQAEDDRRDARDADLLRLGGVPVPRRRA